MEKEKRGGRVRVNVVFGSSSEEEGEEEVKVLTETGEVKRREARNKAATITLAIIILLGYNLPHHSLYF